MPKITTSFETKGFETIQRKLQQRLLKTQTKKKHIFEDPLSRTLSSIRRRLQKDSDAGGINHVYTGKMYNSVGSRSTIPSLETMTILFGTFVPYGRIFELGGKPRFISYAKLAPWAKHRFGTEGPTIPIQRSIKKIGTRSYPIVQKSWDGNKDNYLSIVHRRFWKIWSP